MLTSLDHTNSPVQFHLHLQTVRFFPGFLAKIASYYTAGTTSSCADIQSEAQSRPAKGGKLILIEKMVAS